MKPTISSLTEQIMEEFKKSDVFQRIDAVEGIASIHGFNEYKGQTIQQFIETHFRSMAETLLGNADEMAERIVIEYANITGRESEQRPFVREAAKKVLESAIKQAKL